MNAKVVGGILTVVALGLVGLNWSSLKPVAAPSGRLGKLQFPVGPDFNPGAGRPSQENHITYQGRCEDPIVTARFLRKYLPGAVEKDVTEDSKMYFEHTFDWPGVKTAGKNHLRITVNPMFIDIDETYVAGAEPKSVP